MLRKTEISQSSSFQCFVHYTSRRYHYNADWPLLIICPSSLRHTWAGEIAKWLEIDDESIQIITSSKQRPDSLIVIVSYDIAAKIADALAAFKVIVADEVRCTSP